MDEKKGFWKTIGAAIGGFFIAMLTFIFFGTTNRGRDTSRSREHIDTAAAANRDAEARVDDIKHTVSSVESSTNDIEECTKHSLDLIRDLRKRKQEEKS